MLNLVGWASVLFILALFLFIVGMIIQKAGRTDNAPVQIAGLLLASGAILLAVHHIIAPLTAINVYIAIFCTFLNLATAVIGLKIFLVHTEST